MRVKLLEIDRVRNLDRQKLELSPGLNYFYGNNGAGKTAVLEALYLLARGRSFRTQVLKDLVRRGSRELLVRAELEDEARGEIKVGVRREVGGGGETRLNGERVQRASEVAGLLPLQALLPDISDLVFGGPAERRSWLDWGVFHVEHGYVATLRSYQRVLKQRNRLLRDGESRLSALAPWDRELALLAERVTDERRRYLEQLDPQLAHILKELAPELGFELEYRRGWPEGEELEKLLGERAPGEVKSGATQWGAHRAEVVLRLADESRALAAKVLSRGQGKILSTAMKLAQVALLQKQAHRASIFLIDDVGAELDATHTRRFFLLLKDMGCQILATSAVPPTETYGFAEANLTVFHVEHGKVSPA